MVKPFLMGAEVEYSMSTPKSSRSAPGQHLHTWLLDAIRADHGWLRDASNATGIYIDNGSRYYLDSGNHNELSSPELSTPQQVAAYDRAGERILLRAKAAVQAQGSGHDICITKNNVNFSVPDRAAWGQHEAYTCWISLKAAADQLIPHLVTRIPYAGAGYLSAHADGMGFELSQRARHMTRLTGQETMHDRAIFCTRAWKPSDVSDTGWTRTNLISKDSQRCSFGMYLSYGVTGLLFMIMNDGHKIGRNVRLQDPVGAMQAISVDPGLSTKVLLKNGQQATALDIQRSYLAEAKPFVESGEYPEWTSELLEHWSSTIEELENDPMALSNRLDAYLKLAMFDHQLDRAQCSWTTLRSSLQALDEMRRNVPEPVVRAVVNESSQGLNAELKALYDQLAEDAAHSQVTPDQLRFATRLQALELNYHELGGLFDQMADSGQVDPVVIGSAEVERAIHQPPPDGRAEARSQSIAEFQNEPWSCDWQYVMSDVDDKWVDLRDPFTNDRRVTAISTSNISPGRDISSTRVSQLLRMTE